MSGERVPTPDPEGPRRKPPKEAIAEARVRAPSRGNRKLEGFLEAVNEDDQVRAWWYMAQVHAERLGMSDHSWVHSLFLAQSALQRLLVDSYREPERTVVIAEILHAIIGHRRRGEPYTVEAGVVRVADALDMAEGRSRLPVEGGQYGIHALSAAAIDEVRIDAGEERPVKIEIEMNNSAGIFQVDDLLATKIRDTPLEGRVEVVATVEGETEKRLLSGFRLS